MTYFRCDGIFKHEFVANLSLSLPVKEFQKSVNIWRSYGQEFSVLFFLTHSVYGLTSILHSVRVSLTLLLFNAHKCCQHPTVLHQRNLLRRLHELVISAFTAHWVQNNKSIYSTVQVTTCMFKSLTAAE